MPVAALGAAMVLLLAAVDVAGAQQRPIRPEVAPGGVSGSAPGAGTSSESPRNTVPSRTPAPRRDILNLRDDTDLSVPAAQDTKQATKPALETTPETMPGSPAVAETASVVCEAGCDGPRGSVVYRAPAVSVATLASAGAPRPRPIEPAKSMIDLQTPVAVEPSPVAVALVAPRMVCIAGCDEPLRKGPILRPSLTTVASAPVATSADVAITAAAQAPVALVKRKAAMRKVYAKARKARPSGYALARKAVPHHRAYGRVQTVSVPTGRQPLRSPQRGKILPVPAQAVLVGSAAAVAVAPAPRITYGAAAIVTSRRNARRPQTTPVVTAVSADWFNRLKRERALATP